MSSSISGVQSIRSNDSVVPIRSTNPNPFTIKTDLSSFNMMPMYKLSGQFSPSVPGDYQILDASSNPLILPENCFVIATGLTNVGATAAAGGTSIGISTTQATPNVILPALTLAQINGGTIAAPTTATFSGNGAAVGLKAVTLGTFNPQPKILVNIFYVALE